MRGLCARWMLLVALAVIGPALTLPTSPGVVMSSAAATNFVDCGLIGGGIAVQSIGVNCSVARNIAGRARAGSRLPRWRCQLQGESFGRCFGRAGLRGKVVDWFVAD
jgi:hypothetical protein